jgi:Zn-dependent peptidase ImmA (M78 family)
MTDRCIDLYYKVCDEYFRKKHSSIEDACKAYNVSARYFYYICKRIGKVSPAKQRAVMSGGTKPNPTADTEHHTSAPSSERAHNKKVKVPSEEVQELVRQINAE